ncbi:MAG TPA: NAD(P)-dependent alcohol dehydrogenase [Glycomyces sp.]
MRSYHLSKSGDGVDGLSVRDHERPIPGPGEVAVAVRAASIGFREALVLRGAYVLPVKPDGIPVAEGAGDVVAVGPGVDAVRAGDRVAATVFPTWQDGPWGLEHLPQRGGSLDGMLTEIAVVEEHGLVPIPEHLSYAEAATLPCTAVTAWNALTGVRAGQTVVTQGSGGVSLFTIQFAKALGAKVIATTSSPAKAKRLTGLGADDVIDYRATPDWPAQVRDLTGGRGADHIVDVTGLLGDSLRAVALGGQVASVGFVSGTVPMLDPRALFASGATVRPIAIGSRAQFQEMNRLIEAAGIHPVIDSQYPFDDARDAFRRLLSGEALGKIVITI